MTKSSEPAGEEGVCVTTAKRVNAATVFPSYLPTVPRAPSLHRELLRPSAEEQGNRRPATAWQYAFKTYTFSSPDSSKPYFKVLFDQHTLSGP